MALRFAMSEKRLRVEQLPSGVLFLRLAMGQERFGSLEALRESQTLALGVIEPLSKMYFAVLLLGDHALSGSKLGFERFIVLFAENQPVWYGLLAMGLSVLMGWIAGRLFALT